MNVYLIYIKKEKINGNVLYEYPKVKDPDNYILYAFTKNKELKNTFVNERISDFIVKKQNIDKEEYKLLCKDFGYLKLKYYKYSNYSYSVKILSNYNEYYGCDCNWITLIDEGELFPYLTPEIITMVNKEYSNALMLIGLNTLITLSDEDDYLQAYFDSSIIMSEDLSTIHTEYSEISFDLKSKQFNVFLKFFGKTFKKEIRN